MYDSHAHIISDDAVAYPPAHAADPQVAAKLEDAFTAGRLLARMDHCGVTGALVVQRGQVYGYDNRYVLAASAASGGRLRAVCGIDATDPDCGGAVRRCREAGAVGVRLMARMGSGGFDWLDGPDAGAFWTAAEETGLPVCVHFFGWNREEGLARLERLLDRHALAHVVIDHLTNSAITGPDDGSDPAVSMAALGLDEAARRLADRGNVALKFTAIPLNDLAARGIDATAVIGAWLALFGAERLLWGSDVTQSRGDYEELVASGRAAVAALPDPVRHLLLHGNTARIYGL